MPRYAMQNVGYGNRHSKPIKTNPISYVNAWMYECTKRGFDSGVQT